MSITDPDHSPSEERWLTTGMNLYGTLMTVAHTYREEDDAEIIRIISARRATPRERREYER